MSWFREVNSRIAHPQKISVGPDEGGPGWEPFDDDGVDGADGARLIGQAVQEREDGDLSRAVTAHQRSEQRMALGRREARTLSGIVTDAPPKPSPRMISKS